MSSGCGPGTIVLDGLVLYVDAGNTRSYPGSGTTYYDLSVNEKNGTLTNGPMYSSSNGGSFTFDGSNDYVDFGTAVVQGNNPWSLDFWMYPTGSAGTAMFIGYNSQGNGLMVYWASWDSNRVRVDAYQDLRLQASTACLANTWSHVAFTFDGLWLNAYINSTASGSDSDTFSINSNYTFLGWAGSGSERWPGRLANNKVYNRALTAAEVKQNFEAHKARFGV